MLVALVVLGARASPLTLVLVVLASLVARADRLAKPSLVPVALVVMVLARCSWWWCWWCSHATVRHPLQPRRLESTGHGLSYVAKHMFSDVT
jgi:hypothetical protein